MSGLYNVVFGSDPNAGLFLHMIGVKHDRAPRYRDAFVHKDYIVVYTRSGGNNRPDFAEGIDYLRSNPNYSHDEDDSFDQTYALFYFTIPPAYKEDFDRVKADMHRELPSVRWQEAIHKLGKGTGPTNGKA